MSSDPLIREAEAKRQLPAVPTPAARGHRGRFAAWLTLAGIVAAFLGVTAWAYARRKPPLHYTYKVQRGDLEVTVTEQGLLESANNEEIKCKVRGRNTVIWVIESGTYVQPGDVLVRLDSRFIEEQIDERTKYAHWSRSAAERSAATVQRAKLAVQEFEQGRYVTQLMTLQKDIVIAQARLRSAREILDYAKKMAQSGYVNELEVEEKQFAVRQAELDLQLKQTQLEVLRDYTKEEQLERLKGEYAAQKATHEANVERAEADASRRDRALEELKHCVVRAERAGLVIHPNAARWENAPEIYEGATVYKDRVMLLMPDLEHMQVKVGVHESVVDRVEVGMKARVKLATRSLVGEVSEVASVTRPAGWWTGNEVRYDTLVKLPSEPGLLPGMSAEVEIIIAEYHDVVKVPVAAVKQAGSAEKPASYCLVKTPDGFRTRPVTLGDSDGTFVIIESGLKAGEEILLNPTAVEHDGNARDKTRTVQSPTKPKTKPTNANLP